MIKKMISKCRKKNNPTRIKLKQYYDSISSESTYDYKNLIEKDALFFLTYKDKIMFFLNNRIKHHNFSKVEKLLLNLISHHENEKSMDTIAQEHFESYEIINKLVGDFIESRDAFNFKKIIEYYLEEETIKLNSFSTDVTICLQLAKAIPSVNRDYIKHINSIFIKQAKHLISKNYEFEKILIFKTNTTVGLIAIRLGSDSFLYPDVFKKDIKIILSTTYYKDMFDNLTTIRILDIVGSKPNSIINRKGFANLMIQAFLKTCSTTINESQLKISGSRDDSGEQKDKDRVNAFWNKLNVLNTTIDTKKFQSLDLRKFKVNNEEIIEIVNITI
ncbi:hypothetical protein [Arcobacter peruensis]|uniref:hypothetical protein n=1 Tax=Arcobacter peruensis TaxID=2320140 RepID=UPI000F07498B|nr:hypothetical protein [Arcobacter peruensis]